jgi:hypothetical protein
MQRYKMNNKRAILGWKKTLGEKCKNAGIGMEPYWHKPNAEIISIFVQRIKNNNVQRNSEVQYSWNTLIRRCSIQNTRFSQHCSRKFKCSGIWCCASLLADMMSCPRTWIFKCTITSEILSYVMKSSNSKTGKICHVISHKPQILLDSIEWGPPWSSITHLKPCESFPHPHNLFFNNIFNIIPHLDLSIYPSDFLTKILLRISHFPNAC